MNRREFLGGFGGLVAVSALPAVAASKRAAAMSVNYISLPIGAARPFSVFHISDTHLKGLAPTDGEKVRKHLAPRFVGYDPEEALADSIRWAQRRKCDYLLHTGDLIDCATDGNVALLKSSSAARTTSSTRRATTSMRRHMRRRDRPRPRRSSVQSIRRRSRRPCRWTSGSTRRSFMASTS